MKVVWSWFCLSVLFIVQVCRWSLESLVEVKDVCSVARFGSDEILRG